MDVWVIYGASEDEGISKLYDVFFDIDEGWDRFCEMCEDEKYKYDKLRFERKSFHGFADGKSFYTRNVYHLFVTL